MLNKFFGKRKHKKIEAKTSDIEFKGDLEGNGVDALKFEIGKILNDIPYVKNAYFSKLQYKGEPQPRIALIIDSSEPSKAIGAEVASQCAGIVPMDIMFTDNCSASLLESLQSNSEPLFSNSNLLFECPLVVSRGTNAEMPKEWKGAILNYYVAAPDYESALLKAANDLKTDGYKFENVHDGKVNQLDPKVWWDQYVLEKWADYADHFPSQEDIEIIVTTGGLHKGPALGWESESST